MGITNDPSDPRLGHGVDDTPIEQHEVYLVLSDEERAKGFVRPVLQSYVHAVELGGCGAVTSMGLAIAETYARNPGFYGSTYCTSCMKHLPVGWRGEFYWVDTQKATWELGGPIEASDDVITANKLRVGS